MSWLGVGKFHHPRRIFLGGGKGVNLLTSGFILAILLFFSFPFVSAASGIPVDNSLITLPVFLVIAGISLFCLLVGLGANIPFFTIIGFFLVFVIGFIIQAGNLAVPNGGVVTTYSYDNTTLVNSTFEEKVFVPWDSGNYHFIGFFLMIAGLFASIFSVFATFGGGE